ASLLPPRSPSFRCCSSWAMRLHAAENVASWTQQQTCPALPEFVIDGKTGLLVHQGDVEALATALDRLLRDSALRNALSREAVDSAKHRFSTSQMIDRHLEVFDRLVEERPRSQV